MPTTTDLACGIVDKTVNGIMDYYDPSEDKRLPYGFSTDNMEGKAKCGKSIQEKFALDSEPRFPLLCGAARLVKQKGSEISREILSRLMDLGIQRIIFGQGEQK